MNNIDRSEIVKKKFKETKNCAEAIILTFEDMITLSRVEIKSISAGFERGMFLSNTCGIVNGAVILIGLVVTDEDSMRVLNKRKIAKTVQNFNREFEKANKSLICRELKREHNQNCTEMLVSAVKILGKIL